MATHLTQTASHWGVYSVETEQSGEIVNVLPFAADPDPNSLIRGLPELVRSDLRIDQPYVREGYLRKRGKGPHNRGGEAFVPVGWSAALDMIEQELRRVKAEFGNEAIYGGSYGWASAGRLHHSPSVLKRFLGLFGGYVDKLGNHSFGAALGVMPYVIGRSDINQMTASWPLIIKNTRLVVMFGGSHSKNTQIDAGGAVMHENLHWSRQAVDAGIKFINISPSKNDAPSEVAAEWISIRPNTDLALMIGLAHTLVNEGLHDRSFLDRYCHGYHKFEDYLLGRKDGVAKDAAWASRITGLQDSSIKMLARRMASTRTLITTSWSVQRADHGEQPIWMTVVLASMLGQIGLPGGGFGLGFGATNSLAAPRPHALPRPTLPLGPNPVHRHIPVGRVTEMLLNPGSALEYNGSIIQLPEIKLVYSVGGNPFHHNTNLNRFLQAWQRPDTIIVHEPWWNPAAKHADIVLPATTTLERNDILATESSRFIVAMKRVIAPVATARNDIDIFSELADRLGIGSQYSEGRTEMGWLRHMYETARAVALERGFNPPPFDDFWALGSYEFPMPEEPVIFMGDFRRDPKANALKTPSGRIEVFSETIEGFKYDDCPPHPTWINPLEWLGSTKTKAFPLHLLTNQPKARLHSQLDPAKLSKDSKINDREPIDISRADALERDLKNGDIVRVFNDRGAFLAATSIVDHLGPGIAQISTGAWYDPHEPGTPGSLDKHGNPNVLTLDKGTSRLTQSSAAQTVLVQIERASNPPGVTAFKWPTIAAGRFE